MVEFEDEIETGFSPLKIQDSMCFTHYTLTLEF